MPRLPQAIDLLNNTSQAKSEWTKQEIELSDYADGIANSEMLWDANFLRPTPNTVAKGANYKNPLIKALALCLSTVSADILVKHLKDQNWLVRAAIACNTNCPEEVLAQIRNDSNEVVRAVVKTRMEEPH